MYIHIYACICVYMYVTGYWDTGGLEKTRISPRIVQGRIPIKGLDFSLLRLQTGGSGVMYTKQTARTKAGRVDHQPHPSGVASNFGLPPGSIEAVSRNPASLRSRFKRKPCLRLMCSAAADNCAIGRRIISDMPPAIFTEALGR